MLRLALAGFVLLATTVPVEAQTPAPAPTPVAFAAHAHANVTFVTQQTGTFAVTLQFAITERDPLVRIDLVSVKTTLPVPALKLSVVVDRAANTVTLWNDESRSYYVQAFVPGFPGAPPAMRPPTPAPPTAGRSPLANLEVLAFEMHLTGHGTTAGLASSSVAAAVDVRRKGDAEISHLKATLQLADDFSAFPLAIDAAIEQSTPMPVNATFAYAIDDFTRGLPLTATFTVPAGYRQANSLLEVLLGRTLVRPAGGTPPN